MAKRVYKLTQKGLDKLNAELKELKSQRGEIAEKIASARDFGDLSENAEYDAARSEQGVLETRIAEIENIVANVEIIKNGASSQVGLGSEVEVKDSKGKSRVFHVVGAVEANPLEGKISNESPIGQALLDKMVGDDFVVETPKGATKYQIVAVR